MSYSIKISKEALEDIFGHIKYILKDLENPDGAIKLLHNFLNEINCLGIFPFKSLGIGFHYRGYQIHKKIYKSYLLFYIVNTSENTIEVLRVLQNSINWQKVIRRSAPYHFILNLTSLLQILYLTRQ